MKSALPFRVGYVLLNPETNKMEFDSMSGKDGDETIYQDKNQAIFAAIKNGPPLNVAQVKVTMTKIYVVSTKEIKTTKDIPIIVKIKKA